MAYTVTEQNMVTVDGHWLVTLPGFTVPRIHSGGGKQEGLIYKTTESYQAEPDRLTFSGRFPWKAESTCRLETVRTTKNSSYRLRKTLQINSVPALSLKVDDFCRPFGPLLNHQILLTFPSHFPILYSDWSRNGRQDFKVLFPKAC